MDIKERFKKFIAYKRLSQRRFQASIGVSSSYINGITDGIGAEVLRKVSIEYPELNTDWLLTGNGEMLNPQQSFIEPAINYTKGVPYYNVDFIGGFDIVMNDQTVNPEYLIDFQQYNEATCWCNVTGHSMEPEITHGDMIALKKIEDTSFIPFGEVYAIITTNGMRTIKRIGPASQPENYSLIPTNKSPEYGIQELPKRMIRHIYHVLGCMKRL